jgi:hypothetical protein
MAVVEHYRVFGDDFVGRTVVTVLDFGRTGRDLFLD